MIKYSQNIPWTNYVYFYPEMMSFGGATKDSHQPTQTKQTALHSRTALHFVASMKVY